MIHLLIHVRAPSEAGVSLLEFSCKEEDDAHTVIAGLIAGGYVVESVRTADPEKVVVLDAQWTELERQSNELSDTHQKERDSLAKKHSKESLSIGKQMQVIAQARDALWSKHDL